MILVVDMKNIKLISVVVSIITVDVLSGCGLMDEVASKTTKDKTIATVNSDVDTLTGKVIIIQKV